MGVTRDLSITSPPTTGHDQRRVIELRHVSKRFGRLVVLDDLSLSVERGKCLVVIGPSGTGKSVMLKHIVGLICPDPGRSGTTAGGSTTCPSGR